MYADRTQRAKPNPVSLTAAIGINAALVAALLLSAPDILPKIVDPPISVFIPEDKPPPPPKPQPQPETKLPTDTKVETVIPDILPPLPPTNPMQGTADPQPLPPIDLGPPAGGTGGVTLDPPKPAPVLVDASPDPRAEFQPDYPAAERRNGSEGVVTVRVLVGADGRVKSVEQVSAASEAFFVATRRQALSRWRFKPATRDGIPYESWRTMTVRFRLEG